MHDLAQEDSEFLNAPDSDPTGRPRVDLLTRAKELAAKYGDRFLPPASLES